MIVAHSGPQDLHTEYLIRTCLRYEVFEWAMEHTLTMIRKVRRHFLSQDPLLISLFVGQCEACFRGTQDSRFILAPL